jgi:non-ribosomal peptide synthetase component F
MLTAASISAQPDISARMFRETAQFLAEKIVVAGEKSLDLIQALLVVSTWHLPPSTFGELKFSQYAHMAATMVIDLRSSNDWRYVIPTASETSQPSLELVEMCRTFLATYFLCSR